MLLGSWATVQQGHGLVYGAERQVEQAWAEARWVSWTKWERWLVAGRSR